MSENTAVNRAAALREARRKKILENSGNRLKRIESLNSSNVKLSTVAFQELKPKAEHEVQKTINKPPDSESSSKLTDELKNFEELKAVSDFLLKFNNEVQENDILENHEPVLTNVIEKKENYFFSIFIKKRIHFILLALTVNFLLRFNYGYIFYENVFCPFYTLKIIEILAVRMKRKKKDEFQAYFLLLMSGVSERVQKFGYIIQTVLVAFFSDLFLYLFTFIVGTKFINNISVN